MGPQWRLAGENGRELGDVVLAHPREEVRSIRAVGRDATDGGDGLGPIRQEWAQARACGPPPETPAIIARSMLNASRTSRVSPAASATVRPGWAGGGAVSGPGEGHEADVVLAARRTQSGKAIGVPWCRTRTRVGPGPVSLTSRTRPSRTLTALLCQTIGGHLSDTGRMMLPRTRPEIGRAAPMFSS